VLRKPLLWFDAPAAFKRSNGFPCWLFEESEGVFYGFPGLANQGFKVAQHSGGESITNPTALDRSLRRADHAPIENFLAQRMPSVRATSCRDHAVCMYTMTPDEHPMVGAVEGYEHLYVGLGLSGHGFKMVPALGEHLAHCVLDHPSATTLERFNPMRFA
jgi:glycine/D-amino acid oxidase-like deaminating enzyme